MKYLLISYVCFVALSPYTAAVKRFGDDTAHLHNTKKIRSISDTLPKVFPKNHVDLIAGKLRLDAALK